MLGRWGEIYEGKEASTSGVTFEAVIYTQDGEANLVGKQYFRPDKYLEQTHCLQ